MDSFYLTTPIYYVNAKPHLGHAYTTIVADAQARMQRALGRPTRFLTGTDEHGDKIVQAAEAAGETPAEYATRISSMFRDLWPVLGITNDDFIRTTEPRHIACVQKVLQKVYDSGDIYFGEYGGHYCYGCERFLTDKELTEDGLCPDHQKAPELITEKNYFFRMSKYQGWLADHIRSNPGFIRPERYASEVLGILDSGALEDLCISRPKSRLTWGIELPFDSNYVCYVWFDALLNYLTALDYPDGELFQQFWPGQHLVAKDILKPHGIFWPTMLKAAGIEPYTNLNVHGYWLVRETKMSKSLGNVVEPREIVARYGLDTFRYFLLREMRFGSDASFSEEALTLRRNADLANDLGNLFSRSLSMAARYFEGKVPGKGAPGTEEQDVAELALNAVANYVQLFSTFSFDRGLEALWELVRGLNRYIDAAQPWALAKSGETAKLEAVIYTVLESLRKVALCLGPVMPESAAAMLDQLGQDVSGAQGMSLQGEADSFGSLEPGTALATASNLFPRLELDKAEPEKPEAKKAKPAKQAKQQKKAEPAAAASETPGPIDYSDFQKLELRAGRILAADKHPDADKLLVLSVDLGEAEPRSIVSGLAEHYAPADIVGRLVIVVANLKPRKLRGVASQGMVLTAEGEGGSLALLAPAGEVPPGSVVR